MQSPDSRAASVTARLAVCRDLVVLCAGPLSGAGEDTLVNEGWVVRRVDVVRNPGRWEASGAAGAASFPPRFWAVYTKLAIFNMTEYGKGAPPPPPPRALPAWPLPKRRRSAEAALPPIWCCCRR